METLKNHTILFDAECPMCRVISRRLVKSGLTSEDGTVSYQEFPEMVCPMLDRQRAADEIALINNETGEVSYGVESLFKLLSASYPLLRPLLSCRPLIWLMSKLYIFIASNRRVIVPPTERGESSGIQPTFRLGYRLAYLLLTWMVAASIFSPYLRLLIGLSFFAYPYSVHLILVGLLLFQGAVVYFIEKSKVWDYLGNLMTVTAAGALLLLPLLILPPWIGQATLFYQLSLVIVVLLMLAEHVRRSKGLKLGIVPGLSCLLFLLLAAFLFS